MALLLNIETATPVCSVSITRNEHVVAEKRSESPNAHSQVLTVYIEALLQEQKLAVSDFDAIAISMGPGSYTGLRIGLSVAKGLCYSADIPLIGISTLRAMAWGMASSFENQTANYCPMIDARRMEVYCALFSESALEKRPVEAKIIDDQSFADLIGDQLLVFAGSGAEKCKPLLSQAGVKFLDDFKVSSLHLAALAEKKFLAQEFEDTAYCEPLYLKEFVAGKPNVKGLR